MRDQEFPYLSRIQDLSNVRMNQNNPNFLGFHGTSMEAIRYLAQYGTMPPSGNHGREFFFYPRVGDNKTPLKDAAEYAEINALRYALWEQLINRDFNLEPHLICPYFGLIEMGVDFEGLSPEKEEIRQAIMRCLNIRSLKGLDRFCKEIAATRKGVVLALGPQILALNPYVSFMEERVVTVPPEGLSIDYLVGVELMGEFEDEALGNAFIKVRSF
ncbi:MAG: hypothetical protein WC882_01125 [Candidatus Gracilibacteria bacterium]